MTEQEGKGQLGSSRLFEEGRDKRDGRLIEVRREEHEAGGRTDEAAADSGELAEEDSRGGGGEKIFKSSSELVSKRGRD